VRDDSEDCETLTEVVADRERCMDAVIESTAEVDAVVRGDWLSETDEDNERLERADDDIDGATEVEIDARTVPEPVEKADCTADSLE